MSPQFICCICPFLFHSIFGRQHPLYSVCFLEAQQETIPCCPNLLMSPSAICDMKQCKWASILTAPDDWMSECSPAQAVRMSQCMLSCLSGRRDCMPDPSWLSVWVCKCLARLYRQVSGYDCLVCPEEKIYLVMTIWTNERPPALSWVSDRASTWYGRFMTLLSLFRCITLYGFIICAWYGRHTWLYYADSIWWFYMEVLHSGMQSEGRMPACRMPEDWNRKVEARRVEDVRRLKYRSSKMSEYQSPEDWGSEGQGSEGWHS